MKKVIYLILVGLLPIFFSCISESNEDIPDVISDPGPSYKDVVDRIFAGELTGDPFDILSLKIEDGKVLLEVQYSGGCEKHEFSLIWNGDCDGFDSNKKTQFVIHHDAKNDMCEALVTQEITLDYVSIMQGKTAIEGCGDLHFVNGSNTEIYFVKRGSEMLEQSRVCNLEVELEDVVCGSGFLDSRWFRLLDSDLYFLGEKFYIQPTNIDVDAVFENGKYTIGVRLVEKYEGDDVTCLAYPGPSVPAEITCIEKVN